MPEMGIQRLVAVNVSGFVRYNLLSRLRPRPRTTFCCGGERGLDLADDGSGVLGELE